MTLALRTLRAHGGALEGQRVLVRVDFDVPLRGGEVGDDTRIRAALPTLKWLRDAGARVVLAAHLGNPRGRVDAALSLEPVGRRLSELLDDELLFSDDCVGDAVKRLVMGLKPGRVLLLENLRFHVGEERNDPGFSRQLVAHADVYVNDAFADSHRAHASIEGAASLLPIRLAGLLVEKEVQALQRLSHQPDAPMVAVLGGEGIANRVSLLNRLVDRVDRLVLGGALACTFLAARGVDTGASHVDTERLANARTLMEGAERKNVTLMLPVDHVVGSAFTPETRPEIVDGPAIPAGKMALDIGPRTREFYARALEGARTVLWNGPLGVTEWDGFGEGTRAVATAVASATRAGAFSVVTGSETAAAFRRSSLASAVSHLSSGGEAALELFQGETLPGLAVLTEG
ncbi:MAG: phosphoglycerate kinase [Pseudomonadota bacterium]